MSRKGRPVENAGVRSRYAAFGRSQINCANAEVRFAALERFVIEQCCHSRLTSEWNFSISLLA